MFLKLPNVWDRDDHQHVKGEELTVISRTKQAEWSNNYVCKVQFKSGGIAFVLDRDVE